MSKRCGACKKIIDDHGGGTHHACNIFGNNPYVCPKCLSLKKVIKIVGDKNRIHRIDKLAYNPTKAQIYAIELHHFLCNGFYGESCDWYYKDEYKVAWQNSCQRKYLKKAELLLKKYPKFQLTDLIKIGQFLTGDQ